MTLCDVVGRLFQWVCKKGAVRHGLFLLGPPGCRYDFSQDIIFLEMIY